MRPFLTLALSLLSLHFTYAQDYQILFVSPDNQDTMEICPSGTDDIFYNVEDQGTNGSNTNYAFTTSNPDYHQ